MSVLAKIAPFAGLSLEKLLIAKLPCSIFVLLQTLPLLKIFKLILPILNQLSAFKKLYHAPSHCL
jgi:hypothetical protein